MIGIEVLQTFNFPAVKTIEFLSEELCLTAAKKLEAVKVSATCFDTGSWRIPGGTNTLP
jgi:hypothetical protein